MCSTTSASAPVRVAPGQPGGKPLSNPLYACAHFLLIGIRQTRQKGAASTVGTDYPGCAGVKCPWPRPIQPYKILAFALVLRSSSVSRLLIGISLSLSLSFSLGDKILSFSTFQLATITRLADQSLLC